MWWKEFKLFLHTIHDGIKGDKNKKKKIKIKNVKFPWHIRCDKIKSFCSSFSSSAFFSFLSVFFEKLINMNSKKKENIFPWNFFTKISIFISLFFFNWSIFLEAQKKIFSEFHAFCLSLSKHSSVSGCLFESTLKNFLLIFFVFIWLCLFDYSFIWLAAYLMLYNLWLIILIFLCQFNCRLVSCRLQSEL